MNNEVFIIKINGHKVIKMNYHIAIHICEFGFQESYDNTCLICDNCNEEITGDEICYYIPSINQLICENRFNQNNSFVKTYIIDDEEDIDFQNKHFNKYIKRLESENIKINY